ncbi:tetratricopeptide repeat protein [Bartonella machadoae]|uniref:tetratricopeptide repeat protein n=1 Tax=Bartonella machadoae TaxID=2893471 RepID=UPI001F4CFB45|nr:tetratricopeptide repeat protein [Bartonella machadoae]UNE54019.1 sel1 repeat family protein [Bartonella machadoae]
MIKTSTTLFILSVMWFATTAKSFAVTSAESSNPERSLNTIQEASKKDESFQPLQAGQYDQAYDYYIQGYYLKAFREALRRAEQNDPFAQTLLARIYMEGCALPVDGARAALWFGRAAKQGEPQAQLRYGLMLFDGNFVTQNQELGEQFIQKSLEAGVKESYYYYGQMLLYKASREKQALAGVASQSGEDEANEQALKWFLKGAALGDAEAAFAAAKILSSGTLTRPKDDRNARKLMEAAAKNKHTAAQLLLAKWLIEGRGGETDFQRAFQLLLSNAHHMVAPAQISLARLYRDGIGTKGDIVMAAAWYILAQQGKMQAPDLDIMLEGMDKAQLEKAQKEAIKLLPVF